MTDDLQAQAQPEAAAASSNPANSGENGSSSSGNEEYVPKSKVTGIVRRERYEAYEKGKREALAEHENAQNSQRNENGTEQGIKGNYVPASQVQELVAKEVKASLEKHSKEAYESEQHAVAARIASEFKGKIEAGMSQDPEGREILKDADFSSISQLAYLAQTHEHTYDIMKELFKNPNKITHLMMLVHTQPRLAEREMKSLADSIKTNKTAEKPNVSEPLSQLSPSIVGDGNGNMSVSDFRLMFPG